MRATPIVLALLAFAAPAWAAEVQFAAPADFVAEHVGSEASWVLLVFKSEATGSFVLDSERALPGTNDTIWRPLVYQDSQREIIPYKKETPQSIALPAGTHALQFQAGRPGSLLLIGDHLDVEFAAAQGQLHFKEAGASITGPIRPDDRTLDLYRDHPEADVGALLSIQTPGTLTQFNITGIVQEAEWYASEIGCSGDRCPKGGGPSSTEQDLPAAALRTESHSYESVEGPFRIDGRGTVDYAVFGSRSTDVRLEGTIRLPRSRTTCEVCVLVDNQTMQLVGDVVLGGLQPTDKGLLHAHLAGDVYSIRLDEVQVDPASILGYTSVAVVAVTVLAFAIHLVGSLLFTRVNEHHALRHPKRKALYEAIAGTPGISYNRLLALTGIPHGTGRHHLNTLVALGLVQTKKVQNALRHFPAGLSVRKQDHLALLTDAHSQAILDHVLASPGLTQGQLVAACETAPRSVVQDRIHKLIDGGILVATRQGRNVRYQPAASRGLTVSHGTEHVSRKPTLGRQSHGADSQFP